MSWKIILQEPTCNVGYGEDLSIKELANMIRKMVSYQGDIVGDSNIRRNSQKAYG